MYFQSLPKELQIIAENELNEVPSRIQDDINTIRKWLNSQPHLNARKDDQWILTFLRACKFSLERTKEKIDKFLCMRSLVTEYFQDRDPFASDIQHSFDKCVTAILPTKNGEPSRCIMRVGAANPDLITFTGVIRLYFMLYDILLEESDNSVIAGACLLLDFKDVTYAHVINVTFPLLKKALMCLEGSYPIRTKYICIINVPSIAIPICRLIQTLVSKKLRERFDFYANEGGDSIYKHFPKDILPKEYAGDGKPMSELSMELKNKIESYKEWFLMDKQYCSDESKRTKDSKVYNDVFGITGSFRQLEVD